MAGGATRGGLYDAFRLALALGDATLRDPFRVLLASAAYVPDLARHATVADVRGEVTGEGYTAGGLALANPAVVRTGRGARLKADDPTWPAPTTIRARWAVVYAAAGERLLAACLDFGREFASDGGPFEVGLPGGVVLEIQRPAPG